MCDNACRKVSFVSHYMSQACNCHGTSQFSNEMASSNKNNGHFLFYKFYFEGKSVEITLRCHNLRQKAIRAGTLCKTDLNC